MNIKKILSRLLVFFIGLPLVIGIVFFNFMNHLPLHILIITISYFAATELYNIFAQKNELLPKPVVVICALILPVVACLYDVLPLIFDIKFPFAHEIITYVYIFSNLALLFTEVLTARDFEKSISRITLSSFIVLYSGYLITFVSRITSFEKNGTNVSTAIIATFLAMVFLCDSFAWFFGVLLGKNNRGLIKASPKKSVAGFIGGFVGSIAAILIGKFFAPQVFDGPVVIHIVMGIIIAFSSIVGDLVESIFKRSAGVKDSGHVIPGRGGALDSIDSILMSAPIYYILVKLMFF